MKRFSRLLVLSTCVVSLHRPAAQQAPVSFLVSGIAAETPASGLAAIEHMLRAGALDVGAVQEDTLLRGRTHERLVQRHEGLPVFGGEIVRQMNGRETVSVFGRVYDTAGADVTAAIDAEHAAALAAASAGERADASGEPMLGLLPRGDRAVLVYQVRVVSPFDVRRVFVDAQDGAVVDQHSDLLTQSAVVGRGTGVFGDLKKIAAITSGGAFRTDDRLRPARGTALDFAGSVARLNQFLVTFSTGDSDIASDADNVWTDGAIVDAHAHQGFVYDYYFKRHGRRGLDDRNQRITGIVHPLLREDRDRYPRSTVNLFINNAVYINGVAVMLYGDGDGVNFDYFAGGLDVVGHELTHGVVDSTSRLGGRNEAGALNEAIADIMGTAVEFFTLPAGSGLFKADWLLGEDVTRVSPGYIRSLSNPSSTGDPDHYARRYTGTEDDGGVHINAPIAGHAFYLAVAGGTNRTSGVTVQGIGSANMDRMEKIFYRGFIHMLTPSATFRDARAATLQAATDLYGAASNERAQLAQAWGAVGVN